MRKFLVLTLLCCLAGCEGPERAIEAEKARRAASEAQLAEARQQFSAFIEEATKGAELLESHPDRDAIDAEVKNLQGLLDRASAVYPEHDQAATLADDGRRMMKFFNTCVGMAIHQSKQKDRTPEEARKYIDDTCQGNAGAIRQLIDIMKADMGK